MLSGRTSALRATVKEKQYFSTIIGDLVEPDQGYLDTERRPPSFPRAHRHRAAQQPGQPLDDGQAETKALRPVAFRITDLEELLENLSLQVLRNADAGIHHFDAQLPAAPPAADQDPALAGVAHRV